MPGERRSGSAPRQHAQRRLDARPNKAHVWERPAWNDTTGDLDKWKLTPEQLKKRRAQRVSKNLIAPGPKASPVEDWARDIGAGSPDTDAVSDGHPRAREDGKGSIDFGAVLQMLQQPPSEPPAAPPAEPEQRSFEQMAAAAAASMAEAASRLPLDLTFNPKRFGLHAAADGSAAPGANRPDTSSTSAGSHFGAVESGGERDARGGLPATELDVAASQLPATTTSQPPAAAASQLSAAAATQLHAAPAQVDSASTAGAQVDSELQPPPPQHALQDRVCVLEQRAADADVLRSGLEAELKTLREEGAALRRDMSELRSHTSVLVTFIHTQLTQLMSAQGQAGATAAAAAAVGAAARQPGPAAPTPAAESPSRWWEPGPGDPRQPSGGGSAGEGDAGAGMGDADGASPERFGPRAASWMFSPMDERDGWLGRPRGEAAVAGNRALEQLDSWNHIGVSDRSTFGDLAPEAAGAPEGGPELFGWDGRATQQPAAAFKWSDAAAEEVSLRGPAVGRPAVSSPASAHLDQRRWSVKDVEKDLDALPSYAAFRRSSVAKAVAVAAQTAPSGASQVAKAAGQPAAASATAAATSWTPAGAGAAAGRVRAAMAHTAAAATPGAAAAGAPPAPAPGMGGRPAADVTAGGPGRAAGAAAAGVFERHVPEQGGAGSGRSVNGAALGSPHPPGLHLRPLPTEFQPRSLGHASIMVQSHLGGLGAAAGMEGASAGVGIAGRMEMEAAARQALEIEGLGGLGGSTGQDGVGGRGWEGEAFREMWSFEASGLPSAKHGVAASSMSLSAHAAAARRQRSKRSPTQR